MNSMSDLFHKDIPDHVIRSVWEHMARSPQHTFQVLTKRSQRMRSLLISELGDPLGPPVWPLPNVWVGVSVETNAYTFRVDHLRDAPAAVRFLSCEPLLGPLPSLALDGIGWVIVGAESGRGARRMDNQWAVDIVEQCQTAGVPVFVKQLSGVTRAVKDLAMFPDVLRVREWPTTGRRPVIAFQVFGVPAPQGGYEAQELPGMTVAEVKQRPLRRPPSEMPPWQLNDPTFDPYGDT